MYKILLLFLFLIGCSENDMRIEAAANEIIDLRRQVCELHNKQVELQRNICDLKMSKKPDIPPSSEDLYQERIRLVGLVNKKYKPYMIVSHAYPQNEIVMECVALFIKNCD